MTLIEDYRDQTGVLPLCEALNLPRASFYRQQARTNSTETTLAQRLRPEHALSEAEQQAVLDVLHAPRFIDLAPAQVYAQLLEEGRYLCSIRTMYRLLAAQGEVQERRALAAHPLYTKPELLATGPNELWSWDITKLRGPVKWTYSPKIHHECTHNVQLRCQHSQRIANNLLHCKTFHVLSPNIRINSSH